MPSLEGIGFLTSSLKKPLPYHHNVYVVAIYSSSSELLSFLTIVFEATPSHSKPWLAHKALLPDNHVSILIKHLLKLEIPQSPEHTAHGSGGHLLDASISIIDIIYLKRIVFWN